MDPKLSVYAEFSDHHDAKRAVRALKAAGFNDIGIDDLSYGLQSSTDSMGGATKEVRKYSLVGVALGTILGCAWGMLVFALPIWLLNFHFGEVIARVGIVICIAVGGLIGLEQGYVWASRLVPSPTSAYSGSPVGVRVMSDSGALLIRAREILNVFLETGPREKRWWRLHRLSGRLSH